MDRVLLLVAGAAVAHSSHRDAQCRVKGRDDLERVAMELGDLIQIETRENPRAIWITLRAATPPCVRTTRAGQFVNLYAIAYGQWQAAWKERLRLILSQRGFAILPAKTPFEVKATFFLPHLWRPDLDNLLKSALDLMNKVVYLDDRYVARLTGYKATSAIPYTEIAVGQLQEIADILAGKK